MSLVDQEQILEEHRHYLSDGARIECFRRAIREVVHKGDVVLDLGAGTGIMGLLACEAGASRVYAIEEGAIIGLARSVCRANGFQDRVIFIKDFSTRASLPELVDVAVSDQIGHFGFEAGLLDYASDLRQRFLKPEGRMVPASLQLWLAPVESPASYERVRFWRQSPAGFDFLPAAALAANTAYSFQSSPGEILADPGCAAALDLRKVCATPFCLETTLTARRAGMVDGIAGWFSAQLSPSVVMTNSPLVEGRINRLNLYLPIEKPLAVEAGCEIFITLQIHPLDGMMRWSLERQGSGLPLERVMHSTFRGMHVCEEDLEKTRPQHVPTLTPRGSARLGALRMFDGVNSVQDIEQAVWSENRGTFRSQAEAAAFVAELVLRNSN